MLSWERRRALLATLQVQGAAKVDDLAAELRVSSMTIRRDIGTLVDEGVIKRVSGGVAAVEPAAPKARLDEAVQRRRPEKQAIARLATGLVQPGMAVALAAGSTTLFLARQLLTVPELTVVTNSLAIADLFDNDQQAAQQRGTSVVLTGGVRTPGGALVGPVAVRSLNHLHCDLAFLSIHGIQPAAGLTTPNILEAETMRAVAAAGARTVVLADHTKWQQVSLTTVLDLEAVDVLITDAGLDAAGAEELAAHVGELQIAPAG